MSGSRERALLVALWLLRPAVTGKLCSCHAIPGAEAVHRQRGTAGTVLVCAVADLRALSVELGGCRFHPTTTLWDGDISFIPQGK